MNEHENRAERRGRREIEEPAEPPPYVYTRDPWDERRFNQYNPFFRWRPAVTSGWEAAAPFLLIVGGAIALALAVILINTFAR